MGTKLGSQASRLHRSSLAILAALAIPLASALPLPALAAERDVTIEFLPPETGPISGYNVYVLDESTGVETVLDAGLVPPDGDGIARTTLVLATQASYRVSMTTYGDGAESVASNTLLVPQESTCDPSACDDGDPCTLDSCGDGGCIAQAVPDGTACDDDFADTVDDVCNAGVCAGTLLVCSDDFDCDDGNLCNGLESCDAGTVCLEGTPLDCGNPTQCQVPACDPETGCAMLDRIDGTPCDDGRTDTTGDACLSGVCQGTLVPEPPTGGGGGGVPAFTLTGISPEMIDLRSISAEVPDLQIQGSGFVVGTRLDFENGQGSAPKLRSLELASDGLMLAHIEINGRGPKRTVYFDVVVTLPDGTALRLPQALAIAR